MRSRKRISRAGVAGRADARRPALRPGPSPVRGAAPRRPAPQAPSRAQLRPPNAIRDVPTALWANMTASPRLTRPFAAALASDQNTSTLAPMTSSMLHDHRPLAQARSPAYWSSCKACAAGDEAVDRPADQAEQPQLLAGRRIDGEPVGVVGVALRAANLVGVAVAPDPALAQQPVRREPRAARARSAPTTRTPRGRSADARPAIISTRPPAMKSIEMNRGGPVMPRSKSRATVRSLVSFGSSRWPMPGGRTHASVSRS